MHAAPGEDQPATEPRTGQPSANASPNETSPSPPDSAPQPSATGSTDETPEATSLPTPVTPPPSSPVLGAALLGLAMVARGEIGLLISQIAHSETGILHDDAFLLGRRTVIGPASVGLLIKRIGRDRLVTERWA
jgi:hypothetical protein